MSNIDRSAYPTAVTAGDLSQSEGGLTKRERACIDLRVPESGDTELDALIRRVNRREIACLMVSAVANQGVEMTGEELATYAYGVSAQIKEALK